ncbi:MAG: hypothetical protein Q9175_007631 [Cornicularia normoerica]
MDWPLMLSVVSEGPDATNASRSEDMGGVKLPDAEADDPGGSVIIGIDGKDDVLRDATVKTPCMLAVTLEVSPVGVVAGVLFADSKLIWEIEMFLANDDERGEPLGLVWVAEGEKSKGAPPGDIVAPELELKLRKEDKTLPLKALAVELAVTFVLNWI